MNTLVLGLGNILLGDDGIGIHVIRSLQQNHPDLQDVTLIDGGTLSFTLAEFIEAADNLIIIDAAQLKREPGTIALFEGQAMDQFVSANRNKSVHEVNINDILALAHLTGSLPERRALIGVQPQLIDWSDFPSDEVNQAIPGACAMTLELVKQWR